TTGVLTFPEPILFPPDVAPVLTDQKPSVSKSGRKIRGRGTIRYHTPPRSRSCSESGNDGSSETPPHWKEEMQRLRAYRPPSGEKWSKGDKLTDPGKWDERSLSQRSRSWSHNGYSDPSSAKYSSQHRKHRKEKKAKHKKKAKKQKHLKKRKQVKKKRLSPSSDMDSSHSSTRRTKSSYDQEQGSHSSSLTSRGDSSRRRWSKSERDKQSSPSLSSRDSQSYCRSRSKSGSRSRSYSRRSSRSRSKSSPSRSGSRTGSSSASKHPKTASTPPKNVSHFNECKPAKVEPARTALPQNDKVVIPPVVAESVPVIPLSDSPPPSRWKPGQKPWKPSYERIQEIKAKTTHIIPAPATYSLIGTNDPGTSSSYHKREKSSDSEQSSYSKNRSNRSSGSWQRSRSRTTRSRSYSKSSSRSRSPSSSRSRSTTRSHSVNKSPSDQSCYSGSSSYFSLSEDDRQKSKLKSEYREKHLQLEKKRQSSSESTLPYAKDMASQKHESRSSSVFSTDSEPLVKPQSSTQEKGQLDSEKSNRKRKRSSSAYDGDEKKTRTEWSSNHSKGRALKEKSESPRSAKKAKRKTHAGGKWDSESNSEGGGIRSSKEESRLSSSKEEGEASSDSDTDLSLAKGKAKLASNSEAPKASKQSSLSGTESSHSPSGIRGKSRKQKHSSKKNPKKAHSKKAKEKSKGKKEKKHKAQKQKETFHWQPPLEFGEEEEEEEDVIAKPSTKEGREKQDSENDKMVKDQAKGDEKLHEENIPLDKAGGHMSPASQPSKSNEEPSTSAQALKADRNMAGSKTPDGTAAKRENEVDVTQIDDMEICTPEHNSPLKVDVDLSPVTLKINLQEVKASKNVDVHNHSEARSAKQRVNGKDSTDTKEDNREKDKHKSKPSTSIASTVSAPKPEMSDGAQSSSADNKWKPLQGAGNLQLPAAVASTSSSEVKNLPSSSESKPQGLRIEIKSKNKIRPGSLFDEVRKTARLNRRPRNHESSSEEDSAERENSQSRSRSRSRSKSEPKSRHRTRSLSYSHSRSRSRSSTDSYRWVKVTNRWSHFRKSIALRMSKLFYNQLLFPLPKSRSYTYDSYYSRSRSRSRSKRSDSYHRSRSYDRRSRSYGSDSESDRSYSNNRSPSESSRYS
uniref:Natural killer cell triggering receptor n=1 Tax=Anolis carolinensis TaxID=28377 RepID=G1KFM0_ANOCA